MKNIKIKMFLELAIIGFTFICILLSLTCCCCGIRVIKSFADMIPGKEIMMDSFKISAKIIQYVFFVSVIVYVVYKMGILPDMRIPKRLQNTMQGHLDNMDDQWGFTSL